MPPEIGGCNFRNNQLTSDAHSLFTTEIKFGVIKLVEDNEMAHIQINFQRS